MSRSRISLAAFLSLALALELVANRVGWRLAGAALLPRSTLEIIDAAGLFAFHLASVTAVLLAALALLRLLFAPSLRPSGSPGATSSSRAFAIVTSMGFVVVAAIGLVRQLPPNLEIYLVVLFTLLALQFVLSSWSLLVGGGRLRLWLGIVVMAFVAHLVWLIPAQLQRDDATYARMVLTLGEALAVTCAATAPMGLLSAFAPDVFSSWRRALVPLVVGLAAAALSLVGALGSRPLAGMLAAYGFGFELPAPTLGVALYAVAFGGLLASIVVLLVRSGPPRLAGQGLLILALSGYQLELPYQLAASLFGLLCVVEAAVRARLAESSVEGWDALVRRVAARLGAREVWSAGSSGYEELRIRVATDGESTEFALRRVAFALEQVELVVGRAPSQEPPPLSLHGRRAARLGKKDGVEVHTGDTTFDALFTIFDARRLDRADGLLSDEMRPRLQGLDEAWLGVWPGQGVRLRTASPQLLRAVESEGAEHDAALGDLVSLLVDLKRS